MCTDVWLGAGLSGGAGWLGVLLRGVHAGTTEGPLLLHQLGMGLPLRRRHRRQVRFCTAFSKNIYEVQSKNTSVGIT